MSFEETIRLVIREEIERATRDVGERLTAIERRLGHGRPDEIYLSTARAAAVACVEPGTIREWVRCGTLKRYGSGRLRVKASELHSMLENKPQKLTKEQIESRAVEAARKLGAR